MNDAFEKNNSEEKSILDKMSLIDYQFVEEAQYPSSNVNISKKKWKRFTAVAAVFAAAMLIAVSLPHIRAFADEHFNAITWFSENRSFEGKMETITIRAVTRAQWQKEYFKTEEV